MPALTVFFLSLIRVGLLLLGALLTFILGTTVYMNVNHFLDTWYLPCLELISFLVVIVPVAALFYGVHIQKYFWQRESLYNNRIFLVSYLIGILLSLIPKETFSNITTQLGQTCVAPSDPIAQITHVLSTGLLTSLLAYIGIDIGVSLKQTSKSVTSIGHKTHRKPRKK